MQIVSQSLFSGKNKKNIVSLSSAEIAHSALSAKVPFIIVTDDILKYFIIPRK